MVRLRGLCVVDPQGAGDRKREVTRDAQTQTSNCVAGGLQDRTFKGTEDGR